ncbi:MAG: T9SS type A sorting domain-containing protein, partial [Bacteroidetes bacterium]|nr:T9SS type A sorting domain-containing protein [Bacteroidota bacterium]MBU1719145.1 T9SS type A sorting domain-containing protein [Bacteroidota bacterium]
TQSLQIPQMQVQMFPAIEEMSDELYLGDNIPNPFSGKTRIPYHLLDNGQEATIEICDVTGRVIEAFSIKGEENMIEVSMREFESGVYYYRLIVNQKCVATKKMINLTN